MLPSILHRFVAQSSNSTSTHTGVCVPAGPHTTRVSDKVNTENDFLSIFLVAHSHKSNHRENIMRPKDKAAQTLPNSHHRLFIVSHTTAVALNGTFLLIFLFL